MSESNVTQTRQDGHLTIYLVWPILSGLALAFVLAISVGGIWLFSTHFDWRTAGTATGIVFFGILGLSTLFIFGYAAKEWAGPRFIETTRQSVDWIEPEPQDPEVRFIRMGGRPSPLTLPAPSYPQDDRSLVAKAVDVLASRLKQQPLETVNAEAKSIEPRAPRWVKEFYNVTCRMWARTRPDGVLSRREFEREFQNGGKALYAKYVGSETDKGIWRTWNVISPGPRNSWVFSQQLEIIFSLDSALDNYARAMSGLKHPPTRTGQTSRTSETMDQTRPDQSDQTDQEEA